MVGMSAETNLRIDRKCLFIFPVDRVGRKCRQANCPILVFLVERIAVLDCGTGLASNDLPRCDNMGFRFSFHLHPSPDNNGHFFELRGLRWFGPARRGDHMRYGKPSIPGRNPSEVLLNKLIARSGNSHWRTLDGA